VRLVGQTVAVRVAEATAFTLFGEVLTGEQVGVTAEEGCGQGEAACSAPVGESGRRFGLPVV
jgi:hypothetical protein